MEDMEGRAGPASHTNPVSGLMLSIFSELLDLCNQM